MKWYGKVMFEEIILETLKKPLSLYLLVWLLVPSCHNGLLDPVIGISVIRRGLPPHICRGDEAKQNKTKSL